jgi:hypothetical protein
MSSGHAEYRLLYPDGHWCIWLSLRDAIKAKRVWSKIKPTDRVLLQRRMVTRWETCHD